MLPPAPLLQLIQHQSAQPVDPPLETLRDILLVRYGLAVQGILFYGSCLRSGDAHEGLVDLYVVVDSYRSAYGKSIPSLFNALLPPNVFYLEVPFGDDKVRSKYAVLSLRDLQRGTSMSWFHSYLWGRFAQPTVVAYARDEAIAQEIHGALAQAVMTFATHTLPCLPERFDARELWRRGLTLSYQSELRAEKPGRVEDLIEASRGYYEQVASAVIPALPYVVDVESIAPFLSYRARIPAWRRHVGRLSWVVRRFQGKMLSVLRLVKAAFTFQGGVDYLVWKLERHTGVAIEVTPRLRRYPLLFVWGHFWRLYRRGVFR